MRHAAGRMPTVESVFQVGELTVDMARRTVTVVGTPVHLTPTEYRLLAVLVRNAGKVITHRQLLKDVWGPDAVHENQYLRVYMGTLRRKIEANPTRPRYLTTEAGVGYRLLEEEPPGVTSIDRPHRTNSGGS